jgi:hypothetical protein
MPLKERNPACSIAWIVVLVVDLPSHRGITKVAPQNKRPSCEADSSSPGREGCHGD